MIKYIPGSLYLGNVCVRSIERRMGAFTCNVTRKHVPADGASGVGYVDKLLYIRNYTYAIRWRVGMWGPGCILHPTDYTDIHAAVIETKLSSST